MTSRAGIRVAAGVLALGVLVGAGEIITTSAWGVAEAPAVTAVDSNPVTHFGTCMTAGGEGDLLLLIDESGSLRDTDPQATRVAAVKYLLNQLAAFADTSDATLDVKIAVFGDSYTDLSDWTRLDGSSVGGLNTVADGLASRNNGLDTDYWTALENSRRDLAERKAARADAVSCQAIAWFTDGQLDFDPRTTKRMKAKYGETKDFAPDIILDSEEAAQQLAGIATGLICEASGLADQLRASGVVTFVVGLDASAPDFSLVQSIATGESPSGATCGELTQPPMGTFATAGDIDALLFAFDSLGSPGQEPIVTESGICQVDTCLEETHKFVLDASTSAVHILASADVGGLNVSLIAPNGDIIALEPKEVGTSSTGSIGAGSANYSWQSAKTVSIDLSEADDAAWSGLWQLAFVDPGGASAGKRSFSNMRISSDFRPALVGPAAEDWLQNDTIDLSLGIVGKDGKAIDPASLQGTIALTASFVDAQGKQKVLAQDIGATDIAKTIPVDLTGIAIGGGTLTLELVHTTADATVDGEVVAPGTALQPQTTDVRIGVRPPLDFPVLTTERLDFGVLDGATSSETSLAFTGTGCVWLDASSLDVEVGPKAAGQVRVEATKAISATTCVPAADGLEVKFQVDDQANGSVIGTIDVLLAPTNETDRAIPATLSFTADLRKPINVAHRNLGFVLALVLGIGIPVAMVYIAKFVVARIPARALVAERIVISVVDGQVLRDGSPFALRPTDFREMAGIKSGGARSLDVAGVSLVTRIGASPSTAGYVVAETPGYASASDGSPAWVSKTPRARLPLAIHNHWIVLHPLGAAASDAEVVIFASGEASADSRDTIASDLINRLPRLLEQLVAASGGATTGEAGDDAGWGGPEGASTAGAGFGSDAGGAGFGSSASGVDSGFDGGARPSGGASGFGFDN